MDDVKVIEEVLSGNSDQFEFLILKYQNQLFTTVVTIVKNSDIAEEILQDSFVTAYEKLETLKNRNYFYPWIKKIAINKSFLYLHHNKKNVGSTEEVLDFLKNDNPIEIDRPFNKSPEALVLNKELAKYIKRFVDSLPERLRSVIILREVEGLSYEEISETMKIPVGTVRSRLHYAREIIKDRLTNQGLADGLQAIS
jgi:RNA polymerase sigma-70 factor (ECF subfamily)